jgi:hypothetical protein
MNKNDRVKEYNDDLASTGKPRNLFRWWIGWDSEDLQNFIFFSLQIIKPPFATSGNSLNPL